MPNSKNLGRLRLALICVAISFAQGWAILKGPSHNWFVYACLYIGTIGEIPFLLLNGVHGDSQGVAGVMGGALFVIVNASVYYGVVASINKVVRRFLSVSRN